MLIFCRRFCRVAALSVMPVLGLLTAGVLATDPPKTPAGNTDAPAKAQAQAPATAAAAAEKTGGTVSPASAPAPPPAPAAGERLSATEAAARARLLHSALHGALQVMHRDFFRRGDTKIIPSGALVDVFKSIEQEWGVALRWLAPDETIMNDDHAPRDAFERRALTAVAGPEKELVAEEKEVLRFAGAVVLQNDCLKCHIPNRKSLEDRFSALSITIPLTRPATP